MKRFNLTLVSLAVTSLLSGTAASAAPVENKILMSNPQFLSQSVAGQSFDAANQLAMANQATRSGMPSYFDANLGKTTFLWAPANISKPDLSNVDAEQMAHFSADYYMGMMTGVSADKSTPNKATMAFMHHKEKGAVIAKYRQEMFDIEVFNREFNVVMDQSFNLVATSGYFSQANIPLNDLSILDSFGSAEKAIQLAFNDLSGNQTDILLSELAQKERYRVFTAESISGEMVVSNQPRAKRVFFDSTSGIIPAYYVEVAMAEKGKVTDTMYSYVISPSDGKILFKNNLIQEESSFTYRAYLEESGYPLESPHGDVSPTLVQGQDPTAILPAPLITLSNFAEFSQDDPWLPEGATITQGNNVFAYADLEAPQGFAPETADFTAEVTSSGIFDYQLTLDEDAQSDTNINAAIVNLFTVNNFLHDYYYDFGFDESAGNAQIDNFDRGGFGGDGLLVEAQDSSGLNNANMATPADGASPRMQMFLFNSKDSTEGVDFGTTISVPDLGLIQSTTASFGAIEYDVSGQIVRLEDGSTGEDGTGTVFDGCEAATNADAISGNIALIDRGSCFFTLKALNAQNAGAIGVLIANNVDDGFDSPVGGADDNVTIATRGINFQNGALITDAIDNGEVAEGRIFENFALKDGTFDNGIVAHEFGHYIQNRLVGNASGLGNFQGRAMGEGWADFHALLFQAEEADTQIQGNDAFQANYGVGTFVVDFFQGIRRAPYSVNMEVNPLTFQHITSGAEPPGIPPTNPNGGNAPHPPGELWAISLWDIYVGLIGVHGFDEAQDRMSRYVIEGLMLTPISPLYTEARDAILAAINAEDVNDFELALEAFARRGMGLGAVAPERDSDDLSGVVESFTNELESFIARDIDINPSFNGIELGFCSNDEILDVGETGTISFEVFNNGSETLIDQLAQVVVLNAEGEDISDQVTFENDGLITIPEVAPFSSVQIDPVMVTLLEAEVGEVLDFSVTFPELLDDDETIEATPLTFSTIVNVDFALEELTSNLASDDMETLSVLEDWPESVLIGGELAVATRSLDSVNTGFFQDRNPDVNLGLQTQQFANNPFMSDVAYATRPFVVADEGDFEISFWHFYLLETGFDGGVVEVSVDGGDWIDVSEAGGEFSVGYSDIDTSNSSALLGRAAYTDTNAAPGFPVGETGNVETISFGSELNGSEVRFRFRILTDINTSSFGWNIDNVTFTNVSSPIFSDIIAGDSVACDISTPIIDLGDSAAITLTEEEQGTLTADVVIRNNMDEVPVNYLWEQVQGPDAVSLEGADTPTLTFTPPDVTEDTEIAFQLTVSVADQSASVMSSVTVMAVAPPPPPAPTPQPRGSSGGGSTGWFALLLLPLVGIMRRRKKQ